MDTSPFVPCAISSIELQPLECDLHPLMTSWICLLPTSRMGSVIAIRRKLIPWVEVQAS